VGVQVGTIGPLVELASVVSASVSASVGSVVVRVVSVLAELVTGSTGFPVELADISVVTPSLELASGPVVPIEVVRSDDPVGSSTGSVHSPASSGGARLP
jgi:hypothetical protein